MPPLKLLVLGAIIVLSPGAANVIEVFPLLFDWFSGDNYKRGVLKKKITDIYPGMGGQKLTKIKKSDVIKIFNF